MPRSRLRPGYNVDCPVTFQRSPFYNGLSVTFSHPDLPEFYEEVKKDTNRGRHWKQFQHYKRWVGTNDGLGINFTTDAWSPGEGLHMAFGEVKEPCLFYQGAYGSPGEFNANLPAFRVESETGDFVPPPQNLDDWIAHSLQSMLPRIKPDLSLINSIIELKDFKSLPKSLNSIKDLLFNRSGDKTLRELTRVGADTHLQYKFNVSPLISDICAVYTALSRAERRLNGFVSRSGGKKRLAHFSKSFVEYTSQSEETMPQGLHYYGSHGYWGSNVLINATSTLQRYVYVEPSVFHAQLEYSYVYSDYQVEHARLLSLLDRLGVNLNPVIVWNAIPWSFVVDWLVGVNRWLSTQRVGLMDPEICIHQYLWSIKRSRSILVQNKMSCFGEQNAPLPPQTIPYPIVYETAYRRGLCKPDMNSLTTSGLSFTEASLANSLVFSRRKRHSNRR